MDNYVLELSAITKEFNGVKALDKMRFQLKKGEIHALMGENGAGKSTFIKVITGVHAPSSGEIKLHGKSISFTNPKEAEKHGIAAIYQHVTNYPDLSITENIFMGHEKVHAKTKRLKWREMHSEAKRLLRELGSGLDPKMEMGTLSVAQQQIVEIAKAISMEAGIIIMDEPTAALTARESEELYKITETLRDSGKSIIFISHRFEDMYRLADRVTAVRDGKYIGTWKTDEISNEKLIVAMVGREITQIYPEKRHPIGSTLLEVKNLSKLGYYKDINFTVRQGEIVSFTGLVGAGRTEVCQSLFGITRYDKGEVTLDEQKITIRNPKHAMQLGIGYLPEDRQQQGLVLNWDISKNITLSRLNSFATMHWLHPKREHQQAKSLAEKVNVKANTIYDLVSSLSGGNQQKVAVAKLLAADLKLIILDEPTKGVDVGAKAAIYEIITELAKSGYGVLLISSEMPEVLGLSDRIVVMREGRVTRTFHNKGITQEMILEAAMQEGKTEQAL